MSFTLDVANFVAKTKRNNETVMRQVSLKLFSAIILASPVDTGRFRMNWQISGGLPASGVLPGEDKSGNVASTRVERFVVNNQYWEDFTLTNNLPYAVVIEFGGYSTGFMGPARPDASNLDSFSGPHKTSGFVGPKRQREQKTVNGYSKQAPQGVVRVNVTRFNTLLEEEAAKVR